MRDLWPMIRVNYARWSGTGTTTTTGVVLLMSHTTGGTAGTTGNSLEFPKHLSQSGSNPYLLNIDMWLRWHHCDKSGGAEVDAFND